MAGAESFVAVVISAHCWVLREHASVSFMGNDNDLLGFLVHTGEAGKSSAGAGFGFEWVCCLRTAQWTRASLLVSV